MNGAWGSKYVDDDLEDVPLTPMSIGVPVYRGRSDRDYQKVGWVAWANDSVYVATMKFLFSLTVFVVVVGAIAFSYNIGCIYCLLAIVGVCMCLFCSMPYLGVPLLITIVLLVVMGWHLGNGAFSIIWGPA